MINSVKQLDEMARDMAFEIWLGDTEHRPNRTYIIEDLSSLSPLSPSEVKAFKERVAYHSPDFGLAKYTPSEEFVSREVDEYFSLCPKVEVRDSDAPARDVFAHLSDEQDRGKWFKFPNGERFRCTEARKTNMCERNMDFYAKRGITIDMFSKAVEISPREVIDAAILDVYYGSSPIRRETYFDGDLSPYYGDSVVARIDPDANTLTKYLKGDEPKTYKLEELSDDELSHLASALENVRCMESAAQIEDGSTIEFNNNLGRIESKSHYVFEFDKPFPVSYENHFDSSMNVRSMIATKIVHSPSHTSVVGIDCSGGIREARYVGLEDLNEKSLDKVFHATDVALKNYLKNYEKMQKAVVNTLDRYPSRIGAVKF